MGADMRPNLRDSGWAGSLFPEPITPVAIASDRCVCHQDCPQYETCETEALDKGSKIYYLLRCVKGKFPACANCKCMACDRYHECKDGPEMGQRGGTRYRMCNRPISITGCPDYSGSVPWATEPVCKKCDHVCDLRKELVWAPRVRCDLNPIEPTKKPTEEPSPVQLDGTWRNVSIIDNVVTVDGVICDDNFVPLTQFAPKPARAKKQPKARSIPLPNEGCDRCLCNTCLNEKACGKCKGLNEICSSRNHPRTVGCPAYSKAEGEGWSCSDCLCPQCANKGQSCHTCEGPVYCSKHGGKIGNCPDFRTEEGKEQHCLENGCLCFKCQLIGDNCEECPGPIRCDGPRMKCKEYVGAEVEA